MAEKRRSKEKLWVQTNGRNVFPPSLSLEESLLLGRYGMNLCSASYCLLRKLVQALQAHIQMKFSCEPSKLKIRLSLALFPLQ